MDEKQGITPHVHHVELVFTTTLVVGPDEDPFTVAADAYESLDGQVPGYTKLMWACQEERSGGVWESYPREEEENDER